MSDWIRREALTIILIGIRTSHNFLINMLSVLSLSLNFTVVMLSYKAELLKLV
jgi:hypothetical protein